MTMKKTLPYISTIFLVFGFAGCTDDFDRNGELEPSLSVHWFRPSETEFDYYLSEACSETFTVESLETPWKFSDVPDWITLTPSSGKTSASVTLSVQENKSADNERTATFYLQSSDPDWPYSCAISVRQAKALPSLSVSETSLSYGGDASGQTVNITANCTWTATCYDSWVSLSPDVNAGKLTISVSANPQSKRRSSTVFISYGYNKSVSISITQSPATLASLPYLPQKERSAAE